MSTTRFEEGKERGGGGEDGLAHTKKVVPKKCGETLLLNNTFICSSSSSFFFSSMKTEILPQHYNSDRVLIPFCFGWHGFAVLSDSIACWAENSRL